VTLNTCLVCEAKRALQVCKSLLVHSLVGGGSGILKEIHVHLKHRFTANCSSCVDTLL
jgi:hypothetical protein